MNHTEDQVQEIDRERNKTLQVIATVIASILIPYFIYTGLSIRREEKVRRDYLDQRIIPSYDTNHNGGLDREEFRKLVDDTIIEQVRVKYDEVFQKRSTKYSGVLYPRELESVIKDSVSSSIYEETRRKETNRHKLEE